MSDIVAAIGGTIRPRGGLGNLVKAAVRQLMHDILTDRKFHAEVVAAGIFHWRIAFGKEFGALYDGNRAGCDALADVVFRGCEARWRDLYLTPSSAYYDGLTAGQLLDKLVVKSAPTQEEIDDAWEIEIASDERSMRRHYEGSARVRKGRDLGEIKVKPEVPS